MECGDRSHRFDSGEPQLVPPGGKAVTAVTALQNEDAR